MLPAVRLTTPDEGFESLGRFDGAILSRLTNVTATSGSASSSASGSSVPSNAAPNVSPSGSDLTKGEAHSVGCEGGGVGSLGAGLLGSEDVGAGWLVVPASAEQMPDCLTGSAVPGWCCFLMCPYLPRSDRHIQHKQGLDSVYQRASEAPSARGATVKRLI